jgi:apolipoprotein N-acyltransferase
MTVAAPEAPSAPQATPARLRRPAAGTLVRLAAAGACGVALYLSFPPYGWWPLAPLAVAVLALACLGVRVRAGAGLGLLAGLTFFVPLLAWTGLNVGAFPWLLLSVVQAAYLAALGAASAGCSRLVAARPWLLAPLTGLLWVAQEALRDRAPFGGFPWGRLAFSQADAPTLRLAALGGAPLVTFAVATCGGLLALAALHWFPAHVTARLRSPGPLSPRAGDPVSPPAAASPAQPPGGHATAGRTGRALVAAALALGAVALAGAGALVPLHRPAGRAVTVAIVQGNVPRLGLDFNAQRRAVLDNHVQATIRLAAQVAAGSAAQPDLVIWPENSSDIDPLADDDADARSLIDRAANVIGAPILVGAVLDGPGPDHARNAGILWLPGTGPDQLYVKRHPVPFAEYMPMRSIARRVSDKVDLVRADFVAGDRPGVVRTDAAVLGDVICFEVAYDGIVRDTVTGGAQLLTVQTNNATFNRDEALQQLAMVRLRAVEHGRPALMASTVGVSGFVAADGKVSQATGFNTAEVVVARLRLGNATTPATRLGAWPEYALTALAVAALLWAAAGRRRGVR